jgi:hypothetical protein
MIREKVTSMVGEEHSVLGLTEANLDIANVTFAFDNVAMIKLLSERGSILQSGKLTKLASVDEKIKNLIDTEYDKLIRPVAAFITFET